LFGGQGIPPGKEKKTQSAIYQAASFD